MVGWGPDPPAFISRPAPLYNARSPQALGSQPTLEELSLAGNALGDAAVTALCQKALAANGVLRALDLSLTGTQAAGAEALVTVLETGEAAPCFFPLLMGGGVGDTRTDRLAICNNVARVVF